MALWGANMGLWDGIIGFQSALRVHFVSPEMKELWKVARSERTSMQVWTWEVTEQTWLAMGTAKIGPCLVIQRSLGCQYRLPKCSQNPFRVTRNEGIVEGS